jgi:hypothetical protein
MCGDAMTKINSLRDLLPEDQRGQQAIDRMQANLRAKIHPEPHPDENLFVAQVPGDEPTAHPLYQRPNPYMKHGFVKLKHLWDKGLIPVGEVPEVRRAMDMLADGQAWGDKEPYCIAVDQDPTVVRYYSGNMNGDEDIFDPSAFRGPSKFKSTILHSDD